MTFKANQDDQLHCNLTEQAWQLQARKPRTINLIKQGGTTDSYLKQVDVNIDGRFTEMRLYVSHCLATNLMTISHPHTSQDFIIAYLHTTIQQIFIIKLSFSTDNYIDQGFLTISAKQHKNHHCYHYHCWHNKVEYVSE